MYTSALVENYDTIVEFRAKLLRQLSLKIYDVLSTAPPDGTAALDNDPLVISFGFGDPPTVLQSPAVVTVERVVCTDEDEIPSYVEEPAHPEPPRTVSDGFPNVPLPGTYLNLDVNPDYHREAVKYFQWLRARKTLRFAVSNVSAHGIRDIHIEMRATGADGDAALGLPESRRRPEKHLTGIFGYGSTQMFGPHNMQGYLQVEWDDANRSTNSIRLDLPTVQPQRTVFSGNEVEIHATGDSDLTLDVIIYSDNGMPRTAQIKLSVAVVERKMTYQEILAEMETT